MKLINYQYKYNKYKSKYLNLKKNIKQYAGTKVKPTKHSKPIKHFKHFKLEKQEELRAVGTSVYDAQKKPPTLDDEESYEPHVSVHSIKHTIKKPESGKLKKPESTQLQKDTSAESFTNNPESTTTCHQSATTCPESNTNTNNTTQESFKSES